MRFRQLLRLAVTLSLCAVGGAAALAQSGTVKLGIISSVTGPHSGFDVPAVDGIHMAVDEIDKAGGFQVGGKTYKFAIVQEDAQSKPDIAATAAQKLLSDEDVRFVMGMMTSTPGIPVANQMARAKVLYIGGFTAMDGYVGTKGRELLLRALPTDAVAARGFVPAAVDVLGLKRIGMILPNDDVSKSIVKTYEPLFKAAGVETVAVELFQPGTTDFAPVLRKFQNQQLDGLFIGYSDPDAEAILRQSLEVGNLPTKFVYRGGTSAPAVKYADRIDGFLWQILTRDLSDPKDEKVKQWIGRYKSEVGKEITPQTYGALTFYDTVFMLARAMQEAGTVTDPAAVAAKLKGMHYEGVRPMTYSDEGRAVSDIDIGVLKNGKASSITQKTGP